MPGPLNLGGEAYEAHVKAQAVVRNRRYRERLRERRDALREQEVLSDGVAHVTPPHTPPGPSPLSTREIEKTLEPFAGRGYVHSERFWQLAASEYPALNLELEALKIADWLLTPKNAKRRCPKAFLDNWLKKAEQDRRERQTAPAPRPAIPAAPGRPPDPEPVLPADVTLVPVDLRAYHRDVGEARKAPWKDRLEAAKNGVHR